MLDMGETLSQIHQEKIKERAQIKKIINDGVPVMAQWLTNPTRNHEVEGLIPGLALWVKDLALL